MPKQAVELKILTDNMRVSELTAAQRRVLLLMEELGPYDQIVIKHNDKHGTDTGELLIISTGTQKEVFPKGML